MGMQQGSAARKQRPGNWNLVGRHNRQIGGRSSADWNAMAGLAAVTFRPGDSTSTFTDKWLRPLGTAVTIVVAYENQGEELSISGYRARLQTRALASYGRNGDREFCHDGRQPLVGGGKSSRLSARHNPSLVELLLRADQACWQVRETREHLPSVPQMPRIWLGFAPQQPPEFEVTPTLRLLAARKAGIRLQQFDTNPQVLAERLLENTWEQQLRHPGSAGNPTDLLLVDAEVCTQAHRALRVFEDFRRLIGANTWNPAREVEILRVANPAGEILERHGIDPSAGFDQPIPAEVIDLMEQEMRQSLGDHATQFSSEDLLEGLVEPAKRLVASTQALGKMRSKLTAYWSECSTEADLRKAARDPQQALCASGACRIQIFSRSDSNQPLQYGPDDLQRRMEIDWTPLPWPTQESQIVAPIAELSAA